MEALAAVSLAGNVIQFVEFSTKLFTGAKDLYRSLDGLLSEDAELREVSNALRQLVVPLAKETMTVDKEVAYAFRKLVEPLSRKPLAVDSDVNLKHVAQMCVPVCNDILSLLDKLRLPQEVENRSWEAARLALRRMRKDKEMKALEKKLTRIQLQLNTSLLAMVGSSTTSMGIHLEELIKTNQRLEADTTRSLEQTREKMIEAVKLEIQNLVNQEQAIRDQEYKQKLSSWTSSSPPEPITSWTETQEMEGMFLWRDVYTRLDALSHQERQVVQQQRVLQSLHYAIFLDRFHEVQQAHGNTFRWISTQKNLGFSHWLKTRDQVPAYWIAGKPGSGKSTLMRYICEDGETIRLLHVWAGSNKLIIAKHFFWLAGNKMQRSQEGLLRSLLYQILRKCPEQVKKVCPERWEADDLTLAEPWSIRNLMDCLLRLAQQRRLGSRICLFVDGLDEYDGDLREILNLFRSMTSSKNFKLCVSSRPWNVFESEYGISSTKLFVETLTRQDIEFYIRESLYEDYYLRSILSQDESGSGIIKKVAEKAEGVFLWVYYVVRLMLKAAADAPTIYDLHEMVDGYPDDLNPLFDRIFHSVLKVYRTETAQILKICLEALDSPLLMAVKFLEMEKHDPNYAVARDIRSLNESEADNIWVLKKRLKGRCMDLVEIKEGTPPFGMTSEAAIPPIYTCRVTFFHRTVRDFLETRKDWLEENAGHSFDPWRSMCNADLAYLKATMQGMKITWQSAELQNRLEEFFYYAKRSESLQGRPLSATLDEFDRVLSSYVSSGSVHWSNGLRESSEYELRNEMGYNTFVGLAIQSGLRLYTDNRLHRDAATLSAKKGRPLLDYALRPNPRPFLVSEKLKRYERVEEEMLRTLLNRGADPNQVVHLDVVSQSVWSHFLSHCYSTTLNAKSVDQLDKLELQMKEWRKAVRLLLQSGADRSAKCQIQGRHGDTWKVVEVLKAKAVVQTVFPEDTSLWVDTSEQEGMVVERRKRDIFRWIFRWM